MLFVLLQRLVFLGHNRDFVSHRRGCFKKLNPARLFTPLTRVIVDEDMVKFDRLERLLVIADEGCELSGVEVYGVSDCKSF